jgi:hypothetical protein
MRVQLDKKRKRNLLKRKVIIFSSVFALLVSIFFSIYFFTPVRKVSINFLSEMPNKKVIEDKIKSIVVNDGYNKYFKFNDTKKKELESKIIEEYPGIGEVLIHKTFTLGYDVTVTTHEAYFSTCVDDDAFLVRCMRGDSRGVYYEELDNVDNRLLLLNIEPNILRNKVTEKRIENPESLSDMRVYSRDEFQNLKELIEYFRKQKLEIVQVNAKLLGVADIVVQDVGNEYAVKVSLKKGFAKSVKDWELINTQGDLKNIIKNRAQDLQYIDISFDNKVFYKLKNMELESEIGSSVKQ